MAFGRLVLAFAAVAAVSAVVFVLSWQEAAPPVTPVISKSSDAAVPSVQRKASQALPAPGPSANVQTIPFPPEGAKQAPRETFEQAAAAHRQSNPAPAPLPVSKSGPDGKPLTLKEAVEMAQSEAQARAAASAAASPFAQGQR